MTTIRDAADLFGEWYDELAGEDYTRLFAGGMVDEWFWQARVQQLRKQVGDCIRAHGGVGAGLVEECRREEGPGMLGGLLGIDDAFSAILYPEEGPLPPGLYEYADRWTETRLLNTPESPGAVLPRWAAQGRGTGGSARHPRDLFDYVVRVPESLWDHCQHVVVRPFHDLECDARDVRVACVPFLEDLLEVDLQVIADGPHRGYRAQAADSAALRERIAAALDALEATGADIGMLPECALRPSLLPIWQDAMRQRRPRRLRWLLAGTGLFDRGEPRPASSAVLLSARDGQVLASQDKQFGFTLEPRQVKEWGLSGLAGDRYWDESIYVGTTQTIIDSKVVRAAIAVCEDLGRTADVTPILRETGVTLVLVPIFAREIRPGSWEQTSGGITMIESGAHVVVANSIAVARRMQAQAAPEPRPPLPAESARKVLSALFVPSTSQRDGFAPPQPGFARTSVDTAVFELFADSSRDWASIERRTGRDRRSGFDRRSAPAAARGDATERRHGERRVLLDRRLPAARIG